jgi:hypothetical protein
MTKQTNVEKPTKWEIVYESDECVSTWKYDSKITANGPVSVEHKWKKSFELSSSSKKKTLGDLTKEAKKESKRQKS